MICRLCVNRDRCTILCPMLEEYVSQDEVELRETLTSDLVGYNYETMTNRFEDIYSYLNDRTQLDDLTFENFNIPIRQRQCIELYYFKNMTIQEISVLLQIRPITVKVLKLRGIKRLSEKLGIKWKRLKETVRRPILHRRPILIRRPILKRRIVNS